MKRFAFICAAALAAFSIAATSASAASSKLKCFAGSPATCTINTGTNSATLDTSSGGYAGVYGVSWKNVGGTQIGSVSFSFVYRCQPSNVDTTTCVGGGAPRWSIPIDTTGDGKWDVFAFVDAANCGSTGTVGTSCPVFVGNESFATWAGFAAAHPSYTIANNTVTFVISDVQEPPVIIYNPTFTKV